MDKKLVVFDVDGTLYQTEKVTTPAVQQVCAAYGIPVPSSETIRAFFGTPTEVYYGWLRELCPGINLERFVQETDQLELQLVYTEGDVYPGVLPMLNACMDSGYTLAACSNAPVHYLEAVFDSQQLRSFFTTYRCQGMGYRNKKEMLNEIIQLLDAAQVVMVGDRHDDIVSAHACGAKAVGVLYGYGPPEELEGADAVVQSTMEIPQAIHQLFDQTHSI